MPEVVLASASPRRRELLASLDIPFEVTAAPVDESIQTGEPISHYVRRLAMAKAKAGQEIYPECIILAADTAIALGNQIFGKPGSLEEARLMLQTLCGKKHTVHTGVAIAYHDKTKVIETVTAITFMSLDKKTIEDYLSTLEWKDKAGAYAFQGKAANFIERIEGSPSGVIGLPLAETALLLKEFGCTL